jgi:hypothetical protein
MTLTSTNMKTKPKRGRPRVHPIKIRKPRLIRFPGICADARALGVDRVTLYRVLSGAFTHLPGLRRRYDALKSTQTK